MTETDTVSALCATRIREILERAQCETVNIITYFDAGKFHCSPVEHLAKTGM